MVGRAALVIGLLLAFVQLPANAGYALAKSPSGWVKTQAGAEFKHPHTFPGNDLYFRTTASVNVGGRLIDVPAGLQVAANAASFVAPAIRLNPAGLLTSVVASWLLTEGLEYIDGAWVVDEPYVFDPMQPAVGWSDLPEATQLPYCGGGASGRVFLRWGSAVVGCVQTVEKDALVAAGWSWNSNYTDWHRVLSGSVTPIPAEGSQRAATEQDWESITGQLPYAVAQDLAARMPLPVALPELEPRRVPVGSPMPKPATNPQEYVQPVVDIVPRPTMAEPWRVELVPGEVTGTDPAGLPDAVLIDEESPEATPTESPELKQLCDVYPDVLACQKLGSLEADVLPNETVPVSIEATTGWGEGAGSCPPDRTATVAGVQLAMQWTLFCSFADQVRPVVVGMAYLAAILSFMGLTRKGEG